MLAHVQWVGPTSKGHFGNINFMHYKRLSAQDTLQTEHLNVMYA